MQLNVVAIAERLGVTTDDVRRLAAFGVIERGTQDTDGIYKWLTTWPKLAELLSLPPAELKARGIINTSLLHKEQSK